MRPLSLIALAVLFALPVQAAPTTSTGRVSVTQVLEMADRASSEAAARNALTAYLAGIGETAGVMASEAVARGAKPLTCSKSFNLSQEAVVDALSRAAPDTASWAETPATPIIIADLFARAGCK